MPAKLKHVVDHLGSAPRGLAGAVAFALVLPGLLLAGRATMPNDEVRFCYVPGSGTVYRIGEPGLPDHCHAQTHTMFTVSVRGPEGPEGPEGPPGPSGISGYEIVRVDRVVSLPPGEGAFVTAHCPEGKRPLGGGYTNAGRFTVVSDGVIPDGWQISVGNRTTERFTSTIAVRVTCATVSE
jgi:hypothetical protein